MKRLARIVFALALGAAAPSAAGAFVIQTRDGRAAGVTPRAFRWSWHVAASPAADAFPSGYAGLVTRFLADVAAGSGSTTNVYSVAAEYGAGPNPSLARTYQVSFSDADVLSPADSYPSDAAHGNPEGCLAPSSPQSPADPPYTWCLTDAQIQAELGSVIAAGRLPSDLSAAYLVLLPPGLDVCMTRGSEQPGGANNCADTDFCSYHSVASQGASPVSGGGLAYAVLPYAGVSGCESGEAPNGDPAADGEVSLVSHEHNEMLSDPLLSGWYEDGNRAESADKCYDPGQTVFGAPLGGGTGAEYNQVIAGHDYYLQDEFADASAANPAFDGCQQQPAGASDGVAPSADTQPLAYHGGPVIGAHTVYAIFWSGGSPAGGPAPVSFSASSSTAHLGQEVTFTAWSSTPGATYAWDFGDEATASTTDPSVSHSYRSPGAHTVTLVVTAGGAATLPSHQTIYVYHGPRAALSVSPRRPLRGRPARFDARRSADPDGTIVSWRWLFGDGTAASGRVVRHVYRAAGRYEVTLELTDSHGGVASRRVEVRVRRRARGRHSYRQ